MRGSTSKRVLKSVDSSLKATRTVPSLKRQLEAARNLYQGRPSSSVPKKKLVQRKPVVKATFKEFKGKPKILGVRGEFLCSSESVSKTLAFTSNFTYFNPLTSFDKFLAVVPKANSLESVHL